MVAYHEGNGVLINVADKAAKAADVSFDDTLQLGSDNVQGAIENLKTSLEDDFSSGISTIYNAVVNKGQVPADRSPEAIAYAISQITTGSTISPTGNFQAQVRDKAIDMGESHWYRYVNTWGIPNINENTYTFTESDPVYKDLGLNNDYRFVDTKAIHDSGIREGRRQVQEGITSTFYAMFGDDAPNSRTQIEKIIHIERGGYLHYVVARLQEDSHEFEASSRYRLIYLNNYIIQKHHGYSINPRILTAGDTIRMTMKGYADSPDVFIFLYIIEWPH